MCGIAGAVWTSPELAIDAGTLTRMTDVVRHRGPDDRGTYANDAHLEPGHDLVPGVGLGFRRLSIIDLELASQPIRNEDGSVWIVFNGEIYNFASLREELQAAGHVFRTRGDGETIVHLYEQLGVDCFSRLNGMFAVAIWDARQRQLILGRDRLGQKPLVYQQQPGRLLFGSEMKSLLQVPGVAREIDPVSLDQYLTYQYVPHPRTIFRGISKLPPGHFAVYRQNEIRVEPYWSPDWNASWKGSKAEAVEAIHETLRSSVQLRMQSDVPLGAFLSGGVDSSLIVALMQQCSERPVKTFSIGFPIGEYDETRYAQQVAKHLETEHYEFQVTPDGVDILPKLVWHFDEPFADSSAIPTWYVSQLTRQHVTVSLTGDGGDELFIGYPRYRAVSLGQWFDRMKPLRALFGAKFWQSMPTSGRQKSKLRQAKRFSEALGLSPGRRYLDWISIFNATRRHDMYSAEFAAALAGHDSFDFLEQYLGAIDQRDPVTAIALTDLQTYLPCDLMTKVDIASMAHSLECRQPFLDHRLVELAASLPIEWKFVRGKGKRLLRDVFGDLLPSDIWERRKMGFGVPLDHWFRHELRDLTHDLLLSERSRQRGFFSPGYVSELIRQHDESEFDHSHRLWALLVLEAWLREWHDSPI